jgi:hypothetical protein
LTAKDSIRVIVPFNGDGAALSRVLERLAELSLSPHDELVVVDNTETGVESASLPSRTSLYRASVYASSYHARNVGARDCGCTWLLFLDADCVPDASLLERYRVPRPPRDVGAVAGGVGSGAMRGVVSQYAAARKHLDPATTTSQRERRYGPTANLLVRASAFAALGGFFDDIISAGDQDLCWRLQAAGWRLDFRADASVAHEHRTTVAALWRQMLRYGSGAAWLRERHGSRSPVVTGCLRMSKGMARLFLALPKLRRDQHAWKFACLDIVCAVAYTVGGLTGNQAHRLSEDTSSSPVLMTSYASAGRDHAT